MLRVITSTGEPSNSDTTDTPSWRCQIEGIQNVVYCTPSIPNPNVYSRLIFGNNNIIN